VKAAFLTLSEKIITVVTMPKRQCESGTCRSRNPDDLPTLLASRHLDFNARQILNDVSQKCQAVSKVMDKNHCQDRPDDGLTLF